MEAFIALLAHPVIPRLGWSLVHFLWQAALLATLLAIVLRLLRRRSPNSRYLACAGTMLLMALAVPITTCYIPEAPQTLEALAPPPAPVAPPSTETPSAAAGESPEPVFVGSPLPPAQPSTGAGQTPDTEARHTPWYTRTLATLDRAMPWAVLAWLAGVSLLSVRLTAGWILVQRLRRRYVEPAGEQWNRVVEKLADRLAVSRPVQIVRSSLAQVPSTIGWLRPVILMPAAALTGMSREQLEAIIAHELAHIRRYDYLVNLAQSVIETLLFYHPAVWWVSRRMRTEREHCCDDLAVAACGNAVTYARALSELESIRGTSRLLAAASGGSLVDRVRRILGVKTPHTDAFARWAAGLLVAMVVIAFVAVTEISTSRALAGGETAAPPATAPADEPAEMTAQPHRWRHFVRVVVGPDSLTFEGRLTRWEHIFEGYGGAAYAAVYGGMLGGWGSPTDPKQTVLELARESNQVPADVYEQARAKALELVASKGCEYLSEIGLAPLNSTGSKSHYLPPLTQRGRWRHFIRHIAGAGIVDAKQAGGPGQVLSAPQDIILSVSKQLPEPQWTVLEIAVAPNTLDPQVYAEDKQKLEAEAKKAGLEGVIDRGVQAVDAPASPSVFVPNATQPGYWRHYVTLVVGPDRMTFQGEPVTAGQLAGKLAAVPDKPDTVLCIATTSDKVNREAVWRQLNSALRGVTFNHISWVGIHPLGTKGQPSVFFPTSGPATTQAADEPGRAGISARLLRDPDRPNPTLHLIIPGDMLTGAMNDERVNAFKPLLEGEPSLKFDTPATKPVTVAAMVNAGKTGLLSGTVVYLRAKNIFYVWGFDTFSSKAPQEYHFYGPFPAGALKQLDWGKAAQNAPRQTAPARGKIQNRAGEPIGGAKVYLYYSKSRWGFENELVDGTETAADGSFAFSVPMTFARTMPHAYAQDQYVIIATHPDHAFGWSNISPSSLKDAYAITLTEPKTETVRVTDVEGKPLKNVWVWPYNAGTKDSADALFRDAMFLGGTPQQVIGAYTNENGEAVVKGLPKTSVSFCAKLAGYAHGIAFSAGQIKLCKGGAVTGRVLDENENPVANAVVCLDAAWGHNLRAYARTDAQGRYRFIDQPADGWDRSSWGSPPGDGRYKVSVRHDDFVSPTYDLTLLPGETIDPFDLDVGRGTLIICRVVDSESGKPVAGARLQGHSTEIDQIDGYSDNEGIFQFRVLGGDTYIRYSSPPDGVYTLENRDLPPLRFSAEGERMEVELAAPPIAGVLAPVRGRIIGPDGGPVAGARVHAAAGQYETATTGGCTSRATTTEDGQFELKDIPAGRDLVIYAQGPDRKLNGYSIFEIPADPAAIKPVAFNLVETPPIRVTLRDPRNDEPVKDTRLQVWPIIHGYEILFTNYEPKTDGEGTVELRGILPGIEYSLRDAVYGKIGFQPNPSNMPYQEKRVLIPPTGISPAAAAPATQPSGGSASTNRFLPRGLSSRPADGGGEGGPEGVVLTPDGKPAADAMVLLVPPRAEGFAFSCQFLNGGIGDARNSLATQTGADGRFAFGEQETAFQLVVLHDSGFAHVSMEAFEASSRIRLAAWARVEGRIAIGGKPGKGEKAVLERHVQDIVSPVSIQFRNEATCDDQGRFVMQRVAPIQSFVGREVTVTRARSSSTVFDHAIAVEPEPGKTATVTVGGSGRRLTGRVLGADGKPADFSKAYALGDLVLPRPSVKLPVELTRMGQDEQIAFFTRWLTTDDGKAFQQAHTWSPIGVYYVPINADGTFSVEDVAAGDYTLRVWITTLNEGPAWGQGEPIGTVNAPVEVDAEPQAEDKPIDLGTFELKPPPAARGRTSAETQPATGQAAIKSIPEKTDLDPPAVLVGRVTDGQGRPLAGVNLSAYTGLATWFLLHPQSEFRTGAEGRYRIEMRNGAGVYNEAERRWDLTIGISLKHPGYQTVGPYLWTGRLPGIPGSTTTRDFEMSLAPVFQPASPSSPASRPAAATASQPAGDDTGRSVAGASGVVLTPDGRAADDALVVLVRPPTGLRAPSRPVCQFRGEKLYAEAAHRSMATAADGRFAFADQPGPFEIVVMHEEGFARVFEWEMPEATTIRLSAWARIDGRVVVGGKPAAHQTVVLKSQLPSISCPGLTIDFQKDTLSLEDGRFAFQRAVPHLSFVARQIDHREGYSGSLYFDHAVELDLAPGQAAEALIGGSGLKITGRLVAPENHPIRFADAYARGQLRPLPTVPKPLLRPKGLTEPQWIRSHAEWLTSEAGKAYHRDTMRAALMTYFVPIGPDGAFAVENIPAGDYALRVDLHAPRKDPPWGLGELLGTTSMLVRIEAPADADQRTVDLGRFDVIDDPARREDMRRATQSS